MRSRRRSRQASRHSSRSAASTATAARCWAATASSGWARPIPTPTRRTLGRFAITEDEDDKYVFKTPSLRNIALTAPYFHDGKAATLNDAVGQMAWLQLGEKLKAKQVEAIATFLGSLTDKERAAK